MTEEIFKISCEEAGGLFSAYSKGELAGSSKYKLVLEHLALCGGCRDIYLRDYFYSVEYPFEKFVEVGRGAVQDFISFSRIAGRIGTAPEEAFKDAVNSGMSLVMGPYEQSYIRNYNKPVGMKDDIKYVAKRVACSKNLEDGSIMVELHAADELELVLLVEFLPRFKTKPPCVTIRARKAGETNEPHYLENVTITLIKAWDNYSIEEPQITGEKKYALFSLKAAEQAKNKSDYTYEDFREDHIISARGIHGKQ